MRSTYKELKREIREARFIAEVKSIRNRLAYERTTRELNGNQFYKLLDAADRRITDIAQRHERRMAN